EGLFPAEGPRAARHRQRPWTIRIRSLVMLPGPALYYPELFGPKSCCASGLVIVGFRASKRPVSYSSPAIERIASTTIKVTAVAVLARRTPSASSSATVGKPAGTAPIVTGAFTARTSRPMVSALRQVIG